MPLGAQDFGAGSQQSTLARTGDALNRDNAVGQAQQQASGGFLAHIETKPVARLSTLLKARTSNLRGKHRPDCAAPGIDLSDDALFDGKRVHRRDDAAIMAVAAQKHAVLDQLLGPRFDLRHGCRQAEVERCLVDVGDGKSRLALGKMPHRRGHGVGSGDLVLFLAGKIGREQRVVLPAADRLGEGGDPFPAARAQLADTIGDKPRHANVPRCAGIRPRDEIGEGHADIAARLAPALDQGSAVFDSRLGSPRHQRRGVHDFGATMAHLRGLIEDLLAPGTEGHNDVARDAGSFEIAMLEHWTRLITEFFDAASKVRHGHRIEQRIQRPELVVPQRPPFAIGGLGDIGDDRMEMRIGFLVAVGVVLEKRNDEIAGRDDFLAATHLDPGMGGIAFGPAKCFLHRLAVSFEDAFVAADQRNQRPAFRHRECQINARALRAGSASDPLAVRELAAQHGLEDLRIDTAFQTKPRRSLAQPFARPISVGAGIVVVSGEIVCCPSSGPDKGYRQHGSALADGMGWQGQMSMSKSPTSGGPGSSMSAGSPSSRCIA